MTHVIDRRKLAMLAVVMIAMIAVQMLLTHYGVDGGFLMASVFVPVISRTPADLNAMASPGNATLSAFRAPLYDTQTFVSASTVQLTYFSAINADRSMSNLRGNGGVMPNNMYFEPLWMNFDVLVRPTTATGAGATGVLDDIAQLVLSGRGFARITVGQTTYPEIPLSYLHGSGGPTGGITGTFTAPLQEQFAVNGVQDSGYAVPGSFILTPMLPFSVVVIWPAALTLVSAAPVNCRFSFDGNWHLPIS